MTTSLSEQLTADKDAQDLNARLRLDFGSLQFLKDHAVQGMPVLPGSIHIEIALLAAETMGLDQPIELRDVEFHNVFLLSENTTDTIRLCMSSETGGIWRYECQTDHDESGESPEVRFASASISSLASKEGHVPQTTVSIDELRRRCPKLCSSDEFYAALRDNGNQYGPAFQGVRRIYVGKNELLGELHLPETVTDTDSFRVHPVSLDACVQALSVVKLQQNRTFVLADIGRVTVFHGTKEPCWASVTVGHVSRDELIGDIHMTDHEGVVIVELSSVRLRYLEPETARSSDARGARSLLAIAATFTAEPLEDTIEFWNQELDLSLELEFTPYNQVFQQLLDPDSVFSRNRDGLNVILVCFEDWIRDRNSLQLQIDEYTKETLLRGSPRHTLPNHLEISHLNEYETAYVYKEIFDDRCYLKHGITIQNGDCVFDIGANIGLFSLFVLQHSQDVQVFSFEPSPLAYTALRTNARLYGGGKVKTFNVGVSDTDGSATFTCYENSSVFSSFQADTDEDRAAIYAVIQNMVRDSIGPEAEAAEVGRIVDQLLTDRLKRQEIICPLRSLSSLIREHSIERIDLLKLDAEKSELAVLRGIEVQDWPKIRQVVIEVHDRKNEILPEIIELLRARGFEVDVEGERLLHDSGLFNVFATRPRRRRSNAKSELTPSQKALIEDNCRTLASALTSASSRHLLVFCPPAPEKVSGTSNATFYSHMQDWLVGQLDSVNNVFVARSSEITQRYPCDSYYDAHGDHFGHVRYTPECFSAIGTSIVRKYHAMRGHTYKVIVLDCDQTLWKGVCGEDGPGGLEIDPPRTYLQDFMVKQSAAGMLLCVCSKNSETDVADVFAQRTDMGLRAEHIVSWRVNWQSKSSNLRSLAEELQIGLDSFILIDDSPVECAEVRSNCPEVLVLQLPQVADEIPRFVDHVWALDHLKVTQEDEARTGFYKQQGKRERLRSAASSLKDFIDGLQLRVSIAPMTQRQLARVSQLTKRTNQFNVTTIRRTEAEIQDVLSKGSECLAVHVSDRFGDYGLVGAILFSADERVVCVDTFLLSCRVLGRGVEHQMMAKLGEIACQRGHEHVDMRYTRNARNQPARDFLHAIGHAYQVPDDFSVRFLIPTHHVQSIVYDPSTGSGRAGDQLNTDANRELNEANQFGSEWIPKVASEFRDVQSILRAVSKRTSKARPTLSSEFIAPRTGIEHSIARVWQVVLGLHSIGMHDNFKEIGGTSLKAVQLVAHLRRDLGVDVSVIDLFESPTIHELATKLSRSDQQDDLSDKALEVRSRAEKRRGRRLSKKRSQQK